MFRNENPPRKNYLDFLGNNFSAIALLPSGCKNTYTEKLGKQEEQGEQGESTPSLPCPAIHPTLPFA
jgi:hypothetical protein